MSSLCVQLNQLRCGSDSISREQLLPGHQKKIELSLKNRIDKTVHSSDFAIPLDHHAPEATRTARYYQHLGLLSRRLPTAKETELSSRVTKAAVHALEQASTPGINGQIIAGVRVADDTLSLVRNIFYAVPAIGVKTGLVNYLGYYAGILWTFFSSKELMGGVDDIERAKDIGDQEGVRRAQARLASGGIVFAASLNYLVGRVFDSLGSMAQAATALNIASCLFGIGALLGMANSYVGGLRCYSFQQRLDEYINNPNLPEVEKFQGALRFLKDCYSVTPEEIDSITNEITKAHPNMLTSERDKLIEEKIAGLAETKVKYLKRRTSMKSLYLIHSQVDQILGKLANGTTRGEGIRDATVLFQTIQNENRTKMALFILGFLAAALCFTGMILANVFTLGALPFVLFGIASTIAIILGMYNLSATLVKSQGINTQSLELVLR